MRQLCERWIYTACLCFRLDQTEQVRYDYSVDQVEYSRNLIKSAMPRWRNFPFFAGWVTRE